MAKGKKSKKLETMSEKELQGVLLSENEEIFADMKGDGVDITEIDKVDVEDIQYWISTGSILLDSAITNSYIGTDGKLRLGIAGGKIMLISGEESTGKSILAAHILKNAQQQNALCVYIDTEQAVNKILFSNIGVDFSKKKLIYSQSQIVEKNFELIEKLMEKISASKHPDRLVVVIWDSVASTTTLDEEKEDYDDKSYGYLAKQMSRGMRKIVRKLRNYNIALVFTNQLRKNMNKKNMYDDDWVEPAGAALPFYSSLSLRLLKPSKSDRILNSKSQQIGTNVKVRFKKNRYGPPQEDLSFGLYFGRGIDDDTNIYNWLRDNKYMKKWKNISTLSLPEKEDYKFETVGWKRELAKNDYALKKELEKFIIDEIRINLYDDDFYVPEEELEEIASEIEDQNKDIEEAVSK